MKRFLGILLTLTMVLSLSTVAWANTEAAAADLTIEALNVISNENGVGFGDNGGVSGGKIDELEIQNSTCVVLRPGGEWAKYDISGLTGGTYQLDMSYLSKNEVYFEVLVDDVLVHKVTMSGNTTAWDAERLTGSVGSVYIAPNSKTLTIRNSDWVYPIYVEKLELTKTADENTTDGVLTFKAQNVATYVQETTAEDGTVTKSIAPKFYDAAGYNWYNSGVREVKVTRTYEIHNGASGDWTAYDVSSVPVGNYRLTVNAALGSATATATYEVSLDERVALAAAKLQAAASNAETYPVYDVYGDNDLGVISIGKNEKLLTLKNIAGGSAFVSGFTLTPTADFEIKADAVKSYYDAGGQNKLEKDGTSVVMRANDTFTYDVSSIARGTYELKMCYSAKGAPVLSAKVGRGMRLAYIGLSATGDYTVFTTESIGKIYLGEGDTELTIVTEGTAAAFSQHFVLTYVGSSNTAELVFNVLEPAEGTNVKASAPLAYTITGAQGVYAFSANVMSKTATSYSYDVDGTVQEVGNLPDHGTTYTSATLTGYIQLTANSEVLTFKNTTENTIIMFGLTLTPVDYVATAVYTSDEAGTTPIEAIEGETVYSKVRVLNGTDSDMKIMVVHAVYGDTDGTPTLERIVTYAPQTVESAFSQIYTIEVQLGKTVKTMIWDGETLSPLAAAATIE